MTPASPSVEQYKGMGYGTWFFGSMPLRWKVFWGELFLLPSIGMFWYLWLNIVFNAASIIEFCIYTPLYLFILACLAASTLNIPMAYGALATHSFHRRLAVLYKEFSLDLPVWPEVLQEIGPNFLECEEQTRLLAQRSAPYYFVVAILALTMCSSLLQVGCRFHMWVRAPALRFQGGGPGKSPLLLGGV